MSALPPRVAGLLLAIAAPLCWSIGGVIIRSVEAGPWDIVFWRSGGHVVFFPFALWAFWGRSAYIEARAAGGAALAVAVLIASTFIFHVLAMTSTTVANVLILQAMSPLLVAVLAWVVLGERLTIGSLMVLAVAFAGLLIVVGGSLGTGGTLGNIFAILVALASASHVTIVRQHRARNLAAVTLLSGVLAAAVAIPFADPFRLGLEDIALLVLLGGVQMTLGLTFFIVALRRLPAAEVTLIAILEPVLGPIWVWLAVGERPADATLIGGTIVLTALVVHVLLAARRAQQLAP
jgi:drug/metabolite transporter (DMT)-like permease